MNYVAVVTIPSGVKLAPSINLPGVKPGVVPIHFACKGVRMDESGSRSDVDVSLLVLVDPTDHDACRDLYDTLTAAVDMIPGGWCDALTG